MGSSLSLLCLVDEMVWVVDDLEANMISIIAQTSASDTESLSSLHYLDSQSSDIH